MFDKRRSSFRQPVWIQRLPFLGVGLGFRLPLAAEILKHEDDIDFLEITSEHFMDFTPADRQLLRKLKERFRLVPHGLGLSVGTAEPAPKEYVEGVARLVDQLSPAWWSDHLAMTRVGATDIGHLAPVLQTRAMQSIVSENIARARSVVGSPFVIENIASPLQLPGAELEEAEFLTGVVEATDTGLLLDLMNLHANSVNHRYDPYQFLNSLPLERVVQVHIIGGHFSKGILVDSHSRPTPEEVWTMLDFVARRVAIKAVLIEWDDEFPDFARILDEITRTREILRQAEIPGRQDVGVIG